MENKQTINHDHLRFDTWSSLQYKHVFIDPSFDRSIYLIGKVTAKYGSYSEANVEVIRITFMLT